MGSHWKNALKYITYIVMYFDVFCVFQWAPITLLPPSGIGDGVVDPHMGIAFYLFFFSIFFSFFP